MIAVITWYLVVTAVGLLAWPLAFRLLPGLPDRGYTMSRSLGLLLTGYSFWLLTSLGLLQNTVGGILLALIIVGSFAIWAYLKRPNQDERLSGWLSEHRTLVLVSEMLFLGAFVAWAVVRAYNPELNSTEKPMELTFLNGIRQSQLFPPADPWLSGYSISYYYFGYIMMSMLAELTNTATGVAFNMGIALLFSLTLLGSYGIVYNLVSAYAVRRGTAVSALLGPLFTGILGNLAGFLELVRALDFSFVPIQFWTWLDIEDLTDPVNRVLWPPDQWRFWWWWRASRVIRDRDLTGTAIGLQPIDEFPQFSFLLGDMHPHVLALPFVLLALALAFNAVTQRDRFSRLQLGIYTICFGGLAFLNTWDLPVYLVILLAAVGFRFLCDRRRLADVKNLTMPVLMGIGMIVAYLPWYVSFTSQAGGVLPNAIFPTRLHQYIVMFGPFLVILIWFLADAAWRERRTVDWGRALTLGGLLLVALIVAMVGLAFLVVQVSREARDFILASVGVSSQGVSDSAVNAQIFSAFRQILLYRVGHPLTALFLTGIIVVAGGLLLPRKKAASSDGGPEIHRTDMKPATGFALLLVLAGAGLTLIPEFVYLRDVFGQRLNTVFKFYYAAWLLFSIASAYAVHTLIMQFGKLTRGLFASVVIAVTAAGLVYPAFAIPAKMGSVPRQPGEPPATLNGIDYIRIEYPGDYKGILWLQQYAPPGSVILEAVGDSYTYYGRVSAATGLPTIIGWDGHERQWRGTLFDQLGGGRRADVKEIFNTNSVGRARELLAQYHVSYVFVGSLERDPTFASPTGIEKFDRFLTAVFRDDAIAIYSVDQPAVGGAP